MPEGYAGGSSSPPYLSASWRLCRPCRPWPSAMSPVSCSALDCGRLSCRHSWCWGRDGPMRRLSRALGCGTPGKGTRACDGLPPSGVVGRGVVVEHHAVRTTATDHWLVPVEALTLIVAGVGFWLELVESPPLVPRLGAFRRAVLGALMMWFIWIEAYLVAMSQSGWYRNLRAMWPVTVSVERQISRWRPWCCGSSPRWSSCR